MIWKQVSWKLIQTTEGEKQNLFCQNNGNAFHKAPVTRNRHFSVAERPALICHYIFFLPINKFPSWHPPEKGSVNKQFKQPREKTVNLGDKRWLTFFYIMVKCDSLCIWAGPCEGLASPSLSGFAFGLWGGHGESGEQSHSSPVWLLLSYPQPPREPLRGTAELCCDPGFPDTVKSKD